MFGNISFDMDPVEARFGGPQHAAPSLEASRARSFDITLRSGAKRDRDLTEGVNSSPAVPWDNPLVPALLPFCCWFREC